MPELPAIFSIAAPKDAKPLAEWENHLLLLQKAGRITFWSLPHLVAGTKREQEITERLEGATIIVLLLSADFFANNECYSLMQRALQRTTNKGQTTVVPLLLRAVAWRDTSLGELSCLPSNGRPIVQWPRSDDAFQDCIDGLRTLLGQSTNNVPTRTPKQNIQGNQQSASSATSYHSCFLSYAHQDEPLAQRLHADLQQRGVQCWYAPHNMKIGAKIRPTIDQAINSQDKLLLIISQHALRSAWIEDEIEAALEYERRQQREILFPVRLDDDIMQTSQAWAAKLRRTCNIGDFTRWTEPGEYQQAFERLRGDLKKADQ